MSQPVEKISDWLSSSANLNRSELELFVVRLWDGDSPEKQGEYVDLSVLLDDWEREQVMRLKFERDRERYLLSHVSLRVVLSRFLNCAPANLEYEPRSSQFVRPVLAKSHGSDLQFSLSHSEGLVAIAVAASGSVGVDVEPLSRSEHAAEIAREYLADSEMTAVQRMPVFDRTRACLALWTAKEAALKALDVGLAHPPEKVVFDIQGGIPVRLDHIADFSGQPRIDVNSFSLDNFSAFVSVAAEPPVNIGHLWVGEFSEIDQIL